MQDGNGVTRTRAPLPVIAEARRDQETGSRININWKDEGLLADLTAAQREGLSATQIMFRIHDLYIVPTGASLTRNAILGAIHRAGLAGDKPQGMVKRRAPRATKARSPKAQQRVHMGRIRSARAEVMAEGKKGADEIVAQYGDLEPWEKMAIPFRANGRPVITIDELNEHTCRWPFECVDGEIGQHDYCGDHVRPGTGFPYCPTHARLASGGLPPPSTAMKTKSHRDPGTGKSRWRG